MLPDRNQKTDTYLEAQKMSFGGAERDRTVDPLLAKQVLSQLSYSPI
jgi:hypothetical protein